MASLMFLTSYIILNNPTFRDDTLFSPCPDLPLSLLWAGGINCIEAGLKVRVISIVTGKLRAFTRNLTAYNYVLKILSHFGQCIYHTIYLFLLPTCTMRNIENGNTGDLSTSGAKEHFGFTLSSVWHSPFPLQS